MVDRRRDSYVEASTAARDVLQRAAMCDLSGKEHRVLDAVVCQTALYSRLEDRCYLAQIAAHAHGVDRAEKWMLEKTRLALVQLRDRGLIGYEPPHGRPPAGTSGPAYRVWLTPRKDHPATGDVPPETPPADGWPFDGETPPVPVGNTTRSRLETPPAHGGPTEKVYEEQPEQHVPDPVDVEYWRLLSEKEAAGIEVGHGLKKLLRQDAEENVRRNLHNSADAIAARVTAASNLGARYAAQGWSREDLHQELGRAWPQDQDALSAGVRAFKEGER